jgi:PAS domain S-box-containing protein
VEQPGAVITGEHLLLHKDGSARWAENVIVNLLSEPSVQAVVVHQRDVTERKQAETALRDSEAKIRRLVDANIIGVFVGDLEGRIIEANDEFLRIVGYNHEDLISGRMRVRDITPPEWRDLTARTIAEIELGRTVQPYEKEYFRKDGSRVPVLVGAAAFEERGNQGVAFVLDLTERKRAEVEARESERQHREMQMELAHANRVTTLGELTASIAHEVNQPLAAIVTNAGAGLRLLEGEDVAEAGEALKSIISDANRAADVIARIRALTRKTPFQKQEVDLNEVVREVAALTRTEMDRHRVELRTELAEDLPPVQADRIELQQLVLNLIVNAIEAMSDGARRDLLIATKKDDANNVRVSVCDSGRGLDPAAAERIFQPFYTTKPGGMGMGLAICRSILERLGGQLSARANAPCGAIFEFRISIEQTSASAE